MGRSKSMVKKILPNNSDDSNELNEMFEQMTGSKGADPEIIIPKLIKLQSLLSKYSKVFNLLLSFDDFIKVFNEYHEEFNDIKNFTNCIKNIINVDENLSSDELEKMNVDSVNMLYKTLKEKEEIQTVIITSSNLKNYKRYISDKNNLKDDFIKREPGISLTPFHFTKLDLKKLWASDKLTIMAKKFILSILNHSYVIGHDIYETVTSPDIDIKKFSRVLISNIDNMKKTIPRCDKAFNIIRDSVELLEDNFKGYYKNSIEAENPSIIIESFIVDVSLSQKTNATITGQFRKIIMFMKKQSSNSNDPRVKKLFKILNSQFDLMSKKTGVVDPEEPEEPEEKTTNSSK